VIGVRRQTAGEVDAPAIEELAAGRNRDEHSRVTVLGDADGRGSLRSSSRHVFSHRLLRHDPSGTGARRFRLGPRVVKVPAGYRANMTSPVILHARLTRSNAEPPIRFSAPSPEIRARPVDTREPLKSIITLLASPPNKTR
jgi:hypothetical protein